MHLFSAILLLFILSGCNVDSQILHGYVEAEYQYISPTSAGLLEHLYVQRGDYVKAEDKLFALQDNDLKIAIENAKSQMREAEAVFEENEKNYNRAQHLIKSGSISKSDFDKMESDYNSSKAKLDITKQNVLFAAQKLKESAPLALFDGYVENTFFTEGEYIQIGKPVVSLLSKNDIKVRFFISQKRLPEISEGGYVRVTCDGCKNPIRAKITYIAKQAEYTPPVIYSANAREKMVFMVEATPETRDFALAPGLPVDIEVEAK